MKYLVTPKGKRIYSIYKATNLVNGKIYIGFDSNWPKRNIFHKSNFSNKNIRLYNCKFYKAIRKYGINLFNWEIICQSLDGNYLLNIIEPYFINYYNSYHNGYNMTKGGEGRLGYICSNSTKEKISKGRKGKKSTKEHKQKISEKNLGNTKGAKEWLLTDPQGNKYYIKNLSEFCRNNPQFKLISQGNLTAVSKGYLTHYKKWKCLEIINI